MKITPDTNFFVSATQWDNSFSHKLLLKLLKTNTEIFTTREILDEFKEVLERDFLLNEAELNEIIEKIFAFVIFVEPTEKVNVVIEDPDDNKILECALASNSDYIITYDKHLLNLKEFQGIKIVKPEEIVF